MGEGFKKTTKSPLTDANGKIIYDLYGIVNHSGNVGFGHYHAYAQNPRTKKWYDFNDSSVHEISADNLVTSQAYVLFYKRRNAPVCHVYQQPSPSMELEVDAVGALEDVEDVKGTEDAEEKRNGETTEI